MCIETGIRTLGGSAALRNVTLEIAFGYADSEIFRKGSEYSVIGYCQSEM